MTPDPQASKLSVETAKKTLTVSLIGIASVLLGLNLYNAVWPYERASNVPSHLATLEQRVEALAHADGAGASLPAPARIAEVERDPAATDQRLLRLEQGVAALKLRLSAAIDARRWRFRTRDSAAPRLWERTDRRGVDVETGIDIEGTTYRDAAFEYRAPPPLDDATSRRLALVHGECEQRAAHEPFAKRFQNRTTDFVLRGDAQADVDAFARELHALQHPADCRRARLLLYPQNQDCGIGAELHWMQMALTAAFESNRTLVVREDQGWTFADPAHCGEKSFSCYFEPLSGCDVHNEAELNALLHDYDAWPPYVTTSNFSDAALAQQRVLHWRNNGDFKFSRVFPERARGRAYQRNLFWWRAMLMRYQFRVRPYVQQYADAAKRRIGASPRQMSLHIRGGDKLYGNRYNRVETTVDTSFDELFASLERLADVCEFDRIFVSSREPQIVRMMKERQLNGTAAKVHFIWDDDELRYGNGFHTLDLLQKRLNTTEEALNAIKDALILLDSDLFVGMLDSNFSRLVAELGAALRRFKANPMAATATDWIILP